MATLRHPRLQRGGQPPAAARRPRVAARSCGAAAASSSSTTARATRPWRSRAPTTASCRSRCSSRSATRARARVRPRLPPRARLGDRGRADRHARVRHHERPRRARRDARHGALGRRRRARLASRRRRARQRRRATGASSRAPPPTPSAAPPASTRGRSRRSSASTGPARCTRRYARYGDDFIREPGFACKAEILIKLDRLGAQHRRGAGRARLVARARARASCACCRPWAATRASWRARSAPGGRHDRDRARTAPARRRHRRRRPARPRPRVPPRRRGRPRRRSTRPRASSAASPARPSSAASRSTASTTRSRSTDQRVLALAEELGPARLDPLPPARRRLLPRRPARLDVHAARAADLPGPARRRPRAARRVHAALPQDHRPGAARRRADRGLRLPHRRPAPVGAPLAPAAGLEVRRRATTTCPRPTCGRACAASPAPATARAARSWAGSRAATRRSSTGSPSAIRERGGEVLTLAPRCATSRRRRAARTASCSTTGFRRHDVGRLDAAAPEHAQPALARARGGAAARTRCRYMGVVCVVARVRSAASARTTRSTSPTARIPLTSVVETTHVVDPEHVGGHLIYVPRYVQPDSPELDAPVRRDHARVPRPRAAHVPGLLARTT